MDFKKVISILNNFEQFALPGSIAHDEIAPYRNNELIKPKKNPRQAAVLVHLYPIKNETYLTLIRRRTYHGAHSGQIALPGGKAEKEDIDLVDTALREAREETNIIQDSLKVIGKLTAIYIPPSNFYVTPVLCTNQKQPNYIAEKLEVDEILEVKLTELLHPNSIVTKHIKLSTGVNLETPSFTLLGETVWGATAMILNELKMVLTR